MRRRRRRSPFVTTMTMMTRNEKTKKEEPLFSCSKCCPLPTTPPRRLPQEQHWPPTPTFPVCIPPAHHPKRNIPMNDVDATTPQHTTINQYFEVESTYLFGPTAEQICREQHLGWKDDALSLSSSRVVVDMTMLYYENERDLRNSNKFWKFENLEPILKI